MAQPHEIGALARALHAYQLADGTHVQKMEVALRAADPNQHLLPAFRLTLEIWDAENTDVMPARKPAHRALFAAWWFIENVTEETPDRQDIYFALREIITKAQRP